ncbi:MAG: recombination protein O N-terminal domain-containing protein [Muribaculaceae bacterium]|nr:recombination protein O N-terminal domain-containing protein [Muribaculaceae bacterium]
MKEKITGIILGTIKHNDRHNITGIYTRERGRMSLLTPAGTTKKSRQTAARVLPLSIVEAQVNMSALSELRIPTSIMPVNIWRTLYNDPIKMSVVIFLTEFLHRLLRDAPADIPLWDFIARSVELFDMTDQPQTIANFHISFLIGLMHKTGISPELTEESDGLEYDVHAGRTVLAHINHARELGFKLNGQMRSEILDEILRYYECHFPGCSNLKSLDVLKQIFIST